MSTTATTDPVTLEVIENRLDSIVREMANITLRTARSAVVHSGRDFSCSLFDHQGQLLAIGSSLPPHVMPMVVSLRKTLDLYGDEVAPGDIFIGNDPHDGGTHLNDVLVFIPVFYGHTLLGFACNRAHWADVGGSVPGSISGSATEIFQEGLRIPPLRLGRNDVVDPDLLRFICTNVRLPDEVAGDLRSQLASCRVAAGRITELVDSYGVELVQATYAELLDLGEQRMRLRLKALKDATVMHEGYLDNDGTSTDQVLLRSTVTVHGDEITVDFSGTADQRQGCTNTGIGVSSGYAFMAVKAALDPKGPINAGTMRPIHVIVPEGSCLNARPPAACGGLGELGQITVVTMVALSGLVPENVSAEEGASANHQNFDGIDHRTGKRYVFYDALSGGGGARQSKDGMDFVRTIRSGNFTMMSVETLEKKFPLAFQCQELRLDSGGGGRFRGGLGMHREYRVLNDGVISILGDHALLGAAGVFGGQRGGATIWKVVRGDSELPISPRFHSKGALPVMAGDVVSVDTPGGGGWGDPLERDPAMVLTDIQEGKVSASAAQVTYGVVVQTGDSVDLPATHRLRERLAHERTYVQLEVGGAPRLSMGVRVVLVAPNDGFEEADLVELVLPGLPQSLTARVILDPAVERGLARVDREVWENLATLSESKALIRPAQARRDPLVAAAEDMVGTDD